MPAPTLTRASHLESLIESTGVLRGGSLRARRLDLGRRGRGWKSNSSHTLPGHPRSVHQGHPPSASLFLAALKAGAARHGVRAQGGGRGRGKGGERVSAPRAAFQDFGRGQSVGSTSSPPSSFGSRLSKQFGPLFGAGPIRSWAGRRPSSIHVCMRACSDARVRAGRGLVRSGKPDIDVRSCGRVCRWAH